MPEPQGDDFPLEKLFPWFMLLVALMHLAALNGRWWFQRDGALYLSLARSLAETGRYTFNYRPHTYALPGLPAMLALIYRTLGESFLAMNALISAFAVGSVAVGYLLFRDVCRKKFHAAVCLVMFGLSYPLFAYSVEILTDVPFTFFVLLALFCGVRMSATNGRRALLWALAGGAAGFAATGFRPFGPAVVVGLLCAVWLRKEDFRRWKSALARSILVLCPFLLALVAWLVYFVGPKAPAHSRNYMDFLTHRPILRTVARMLINVPELLEATFKSIGGGDLDWIGGALLLPLLVAGLIGRWRRGDRLLAPCGIVYLTGVLLGSPGLRYVLPVLPVLLVWFVEGAYILAGWLSGRFEWLSRRRLTWFGYACILAALLTHLARTSEVIYLARSSDFYEVTAEGRLARYRPLVEWMRANVKPHQRTLAHEHRLIHYLTRVECWRFPKRWRGIEARSLARPLARCEFEYVVLDPAERQGIRELRRLMREFPDCFEHVGDFSDLEVYRVDVENLRASAGAGDDAADEALSLPFR